MSFVESRTICRRDTGAAIASVEALLLLVDDSSVLDEIDDQITDGCYIRDPRWHLRNEVILLLAELRNLARRIELLAGWTPASDQGWTHGQVSILRECLLCLRAQEHTKSRLWDRYRLLPAPVDQQ